MEGDGVDFLRVKITHANTVHGKKPHTIYEIELRSSSTITWVIYKRYSEFHVFHQELVKAIAFQQQHQQQQQQQQQQNEHGGSSGGHDNHHDTHFSNLRVPTIPPKRLTRTLAAQFVNQRKQELEDYLREVLVIPGIFLWLSRVITTFLCVPDSLRPMLQDMSGYHMSGGGGGGGRGGSGGNGYCEISGMDLKNVSADVANNLLLGKKAYAHNKVYEERKVWELLNLLKFHPNKTAAIRHFDTYFFTQRPRLSHDYIKLLFQGQNGRDGDGGLVQVCGGFTYSHVASRAALDMLCRLLDVEKSKDAQTYIDVFTRLDPNVLKKMQLQAHILSDRGNRLNAFHIVTVIRDASTEPERVVSQIVLDTVARQVYHRWRMASNAAGMRQGVTAGVATVNVDVGSDGGAHQERRVIPAPVVTEFNFAALATQACHDVLKVMSSNSGWRAVTPLNDGDGGDGDRGHVFGGTSENAAAEGAHDNDDNGGKDDDTASSPSSSSPSTSLSSTSAAHPTLKFGKLAYKKDVFKDMVTFKVDGEYDIGIEAVVQLLVNVHARKDWDAMVHQQRPILRFDTTTALVHLVYKCMSSPYRYRDLCLLSHWRRLDARTVLIVTTSVTHPALPEHKTNIRGVVKTSGYVVRALLDSDDGGSGGDGGGGSGGGAVSDAAVRASTRCSLSYIGQMDREAVLIVAPDLLGECSLLQQSFNNVARVLSDAATATATGGDSPLPKLHDIKLFDQPIKALTKATAATSTTKAVEVGSGAVAEKSM